jgi:hypothetical protein
MPPTSWPLTVCKHDRLLSSMACKQRPPIATFDTAPKSGQSRVIIDKVHTHEASQHKPRLGTKALAHQNMVRPVQRDFVSTDKLRRIKRVHTRRSNSACDYRKTRMLQPIQLPRLSLPFIIPMCSSARSYTARTAYQNVHSRVSCRQNVREYHSRWS